jgi:hypothetical protein
LLFEVLLIVAMAEVHKILMKALEADEGGDKVKIGDE